jgi:hypothetical protein
MPGLSIISLTTFGKVALAILPRLFDFGVPRIPDNFYDPVSDFESFSDFDVPSQSGIVTW